MKKIITIAISIPLICATVYESKLLKYRDFVIGDIKQNILLILKKHRYASHSIYYDNNDRYIDGIKVKSDNSIKIIINKHMEREEILLVFDKNDILFDLYSKKIPMDIRDYIDHKVYLTNTYGTPVEDVVNGQHILAWSINRRRHVLYLIYSSTSRSLLFNMRDTYLNMKYAP